MQFRLHVLHCGATLVLYLLALPWLKLHHPVSHWWVC